MLARLAVFLVVAIVLIVNLYDAAQPESVLAAAAGVAVCGSMIFFAQTWADYILPFGFWEFFASDSGSSGNSAPATAFMGWIFLVLMGFGVWIR